MLRVLVLTGNKFQKIDKTYFDGKNIDQLVPTNLYELVLIDCSLEWSQLDILAPTLLYVENLFLARNNCRKICSEFEISKTYWKNLRLLNLEQNGIESWDELVGFRILDGLRRLIINKNSIKEIYKKPGFKDLKYLSFEDNLIADWKSFNQLNEFEGQLKQIRCQGNPLFNIEDDNDNEKKKQNQYISIAKLKFLTSFNGMKVTEFERKDSEIYYMKHAYLTYLKDIL